MTESDPEAFIPLDGRTISVRPQEAFIPLQEKHPVCPWGPPSNTTFDSALRLIVTEVADTITSVSDQMEGNPRPTRITYYEQLNGRTYAVHVEEILDE